ncbi:hypothetical protein C2845_PM10G06300 [Panicum miliaceum]|uniref:Uncharacterized protein n=1 Tax=Panicum miliaceum TaxID=4540 RepID=A0A3L6PDZ8_PANMI|nr:hypothetical protein C2845_PM10G06300 [Panicum miliaceum]
MRDKLHPIPIHRSSSPVRSLPGNAPPRRFPTCSDEPCRHHRRRHLLVGLLHYFSPRYGKTICCCNKFDLGPGPKHAVEQWIAETLISASFSAVLSASLLCPHSALDQIGLVSSRLPSNPPPLTAEGLSISIHLSTDELSRHLVQWMW